MVTGLGGCDDAGGGAAGWTCEAAGDTGDHSMGGGTLVWDAAGDGEAGWPCGEATGSSAGGGGGGDACVWETAGVGGAGCAGGGGAAGWPCWANRALLSSEDRTLARRTGRGCAVWTLLGPNRTGGVCASMCA